MRIYWPIFILLCFSSCAKKTLFFQDAYPVEKEIALTDNRVDIKTYYVGDAFSYITFQVDVDNRSSSTIVLSAEEIILSVREDTGLDLEFRPIPKNVLLDEMRSEERSLNSGKNASTLGNAILVGFGVLADITSGAGAGATLFYGTEGAVGILEDRRRYKIAQGSLEEQIAYIDEYTLEQEMILPGRTASYDIHFERLMVTSPASLTVRCDTVDYVSEYMLEVTQTEVRK